MLKMYLLAGELQINVWQFEYVLIIFEFGMLN